MTKGISIELQMPDDLARFHLPEGVQHRLNAWLDKQDRGEPLSDDERNEAVGLEALADLLSILRLRAERAAS